MKGLACLFLATCSLTCRAEPPAQQRAVALPDLAAADAVQITYSWTGLSPVAPTDAVWRLERRGEQFTGTALFRAGAPPHRKEASERLSFPAAVGDGFLAVLGKASMQDAEIDASSPPGHPIVKLPASAIPRMTDHYPSTTITVYLADTSVTYSSKSQEPSGRPWVISAGKRLYVSDSTEPGRALNELRPHLKWERYSELHTEVMNAWQRSQTPR